MTKNRVIIEIDGERHQLVRDLDSEDFDWGGMCTENLCSAYKACNGGREGICSDYGCACHFEKVEEEKDETENRSIPPEGV